MTKVSTVSLENYTQTKYNNYETDLKVITSYFREIIQEIFPNTDASKSAYGVCFVVIQEEMIIQQKLPLEYSIFSTGNYATHEEIIATNTAISNNNI